jgi:catechol 2,3-dioxygenase-like lactoylglutathione lyase family enzyme
MRIIITSVFVDDQNKALKFYTETLGFVKKHDVPVGEFKWLTVVSSEDQNGTELLLEPSDSAVAKEYKKGLVAEGIPAAMFGVSNVEDEYKRLKALGVTFTMKPVQMGQVKVAVFDDTCGNLIQILEKREGEDTM